MLAILRQLESTYQIQINLPSNHEDLIICRIDPSSNILRLIEDHKWLAIQYSAHCAQLMENLRAGNDVTEQIEVALAVSILLERLYHYYLYEKDAITLMRRHQHIYGRLLVARGKVLHPLQDALEKQSISKTIHDLCTAGNRRRLCTVRVRRLLIVAMPLISPLGFINYCAWIGFMEQVTTPVVTYLAWFTLFPRLLKNGFLIAKHLVPHFWMTEEEYQLGWKTRFIAQLELHWFELVNDIVAVSVGLLNCFILTGTANIHLGFALFVFDAALAALRAYIDIRYLGKLERQYRNQVDIAVANIDEGYLDHLGQRITYEKKRLVLMVINTSALLLAAVFSLPVVAISPIMPFIGASIAVLTTIFNMIGTQRIELQKPDDKVTYHRYGMFQPPAPLAPPQAPPQSAIIR